jgi:hypothetical protein
MHGDSGRRICQKSIHFFAAWSFSRHSFVDNLKKVIKLILFKRYTLFYQLSIGYLPF